MGKERRSGEGMETHNIALTALNRIDSHQAECARIQSANKATFDEIKDFMKTNTKMTISGLAGLVMLLIDKLITYGSVILHH